MVSFGNFDWELYVKYYNIDNIHNRLSAWKNWINKGILLNRKIYMTINNFDWIFYCQSYNVKANSREEAIINWFESDNYRYKNKNDYINDYNKARSNTIIDLDIINKYFDNHPFKKCLAFYHTWPSINNAESECLQRFQNACNKADINFIIIDNNGTIINDNHLLNEINIRNINKKYIDAIISLHWESPKNTDMFTVYFLWNPIEYYDKISIDRLLKFDAYVSCYSPSIDKVVKLMTNNKNIIANVNHSLCEPLLDYNQKNFKCFYIGINWELCTQKPTRYSKLLKLLDRDDLINIYGPRRFLGINIWEGYKNYVDEIQFDGVSIVHEISKSGICLVLSSEEHKNSQICSNRLFEGLAANVPLICDDNLFIKRNFKDNVFYIDTFDEDLAFDQIKKHIEFIKSNPDIVKTKLENCRNIFLEKYVLDKQINILIDKIREEKERLNFN